jgi:hypothetical protein
MGASTVQPQQILRHPRVNLLPLHAQRTLGRQRLPRAALHPHLRAASGSIHSGGLS